jgi:hypothetical protein
LLQYYLSNKKILVIFSDHNGATFLVCIEVHGVDIQVSSLNPARESLLRIRELRVEGSCTPGF